MGQHLPSVVVERVLVSEIRGLIYAGENDLVPYDSPSCTSFRGIGQFVVEPVLLS